MFDGVDDGDGILAMGMGVVVLEEEGEVMMMECPEEGIDWRGEDDAANVSTT